MVTSRERWFGNLLDWRRNPEDDTHVAWHNGRAHRIAKLTKREADALRTYPGWHLWEPHGWESQVGPGLGRTVTVARELAEAWIICDYDDMMNYPKLSLAVKGHGVFWEGATVIRLDRSGCQFTVYRDRVKVGMAAVAQEPLATVRPVFDGPAGAVTVRWEVTPVAEPAAVTSCWRDAMQHLLPHVVGVAETFELIDGATP